jgi:L-threonylcarbamoyladenylate synthase
MSAIIHPCNPSSVELAKRLLESGEVVAVPTETVYGLAANAFNPDAVAKVFGIKRRPSFDPLIVHVESSCKTIDALSKLGVIDQARLSDAASRVASTLMRAFWPGPLSLLLPRGPQIPLIVTSGRESVAVRMPRHDGLQALLSKLEFPLAAPSANIFGHVSPTTAAHVAADLGEMLAFILDGGPTDVGIESTVVGINDDGSVCVLRPGGISLEQLSSLLTVSPTKEDPKTALTPGSLDKHYAPAKPLYWLSDICVGETLSSLGQKVIAQKILFIETDHSSFSNNIFHGSSTVRRLCLSEHGSDVEAAKNLFSIMRDFESSGEDVMIVADINLKHGLWPAISDRLQKARNHWV